MIFVTVGTQKFQFNRLIMSVDSLAGNKRIQEEVFIQSGNCTYNPVHCSFKKFLDKNEFEYYLSNCSLLITHSGVATIIAGLTGKKPVIVMPRLMQYGEHVDNHQVQIADAFAEQNLIFKCNTKDELGKLVKLAKTHKFNEYISQRENILATIKDFIATL